MNKVVAGRFKNNRVLVKGEWLGVRLGWRNYLLLTPNIVSHIQVIASDSTPSVWSGFWRGFFSRLVPSQSLWLSSVLSAKHISAYTVKVTYRDASSSVLNLNVKLLATLVSRNKL